MRNKQKLKSKEARMLAFIEQQLERIKAKIEFIYEERNRQVRGMREFANNAKETYKKINKRIDRLGFWLIVLWTIEIFQWFR